MPHDNKHRLSRRSLFTLGGGLVAAGAVGGGVAALAGGGASAAPADVAHPGALHGAGDLHRAKVRVAAGDDPWLAGWKRLTANRHSASTWQPRPQATVVRGGSGQNYPTLYHDVHAAYQNALRWRIGGTKANGDTAVAILNAWSATLKEITGNADRFLAAGLYGYQFANAAELMRGYDGFHLTRFQSMMKRVFQPLNEDFLTRHNDACVTNYWANWDLCNTASLMAIGILRDDATAFDRAVTYMKSGEGNGSIRHAVPFVYEGQGLAQWQESGRDQGHTMMGMGQMGAICEMAWNQGVDLYGYDDNRFMKAAEYVAKYNLGQDVPFTTYTWGTGQNCAQRSQTVISDAGRGQIRPVWASLRYHYARRRGLSVPFITAMAEKVGVEGGGGDYGPNSGGFDQLGFGTLLYAK
ncbi:alginate lyase family protein [Streptomyces sp. Rer75]|uniref:alginate lyase family protein n=1 Tax=unclassified Streptomyces TaxID=2593676 RepID=UPI0015CFCC78|nr:alginate lyase family protein [Streptomyces sp. Rer75]QLH19685.1 alginate lyase family protein [Streptomyces sp. Rer75]